MGITASIFYFILAGLCEIGGGYLVWLWLREGKPIGFALMGSVVLVLYGAIPTLQPAHFGRVYAAYGGVYRSFSPMGMAGGRDRPGQIRSDRRIHIMESEFRAAFLCSECMKTDSLSIAPLTCMQCALIVQTALF